MFDDLGYPGNPGEGDVIELTDLLERNIQEAILVQIIEDMGSNHAFICLDIGCDLTQDKCRQVLYHRSQVIIGYFSGGRSIPISPAVGTRKIIWGRNENDWFVELGVVGLAADRAGPGCG
jgi:hypothetical protein